MGCGASAGPRNASEAEQQEMASAACRDCIVICVQKVIDIGVDQGNIKVSAPTEELQKFRETSEQLHLAAKEAKESMDKGGADVSAQVKSGLGALGKLGSLMGDVAGKVVSSTASGAGTLSAAVLEGLANSLDAPLNKLDSEFSVLAVDVLKSQRKEVVAAYNKILGNCAFADAMKLVRGDDLGYDNCPKDKVSVAFMATTEKGIKDAVQEAVIEEVKKNPVVNTWAEIIKCFNDCLSKISPDSQAGPKLDICQYVVDEIFNQLAGEMKKYEATIRSDPEPMKAVGIHTTLPETFRAVFSKKQLTEEDYKIFKGKKE